MGSAQFTDFFKHNLQCQDQLEPLRGLLQNSFGIDDFWHATLWENGQYANISTYHDQWGYFWTDSHFKNSNFMIAPSGLRNSCFQLAEDPDFARVMTSFSNHKYTQHHPFIIISKEGNDKAHVFGFAARSHKPHLPAFYMNNTATLNRFIKYYLSSSRKFSQHCDEQLIDMAHLRGNDKFYKITYGQESLINHKNHKQFFKAIGVDPLLFSQAKSLTKREKDVLLGLSDGKNSKETGQDLALSFRTVQSYLDNCKNKLGAVSREELLEQANLLKIAGLL
ncbi:MAG: helix-turn-helix transcriptional regulator [Chlamydiales bacterium]|nr:helix-turn-helix transcriptional regulator [Chlamydiales bacterium]